MAADLCGAAPAQAGPLVPGLAIPVLQPMQHLTSQCIRRPPTNPMAPVAATAMVAPQPPGHVANAPSAGTPAMAPRVRPPPSVVEPQGVVAPPRHWLREQADAAAGGSRKDVLLDSMLHAGSCEILYDPSATPRRPIRREAGAEPQEGASVETTAGSASIGTNRTAPPAWLRGSTGEPPVSARSGGAGSSLAGGGALQVELGDSGGTGAGGQLQVGDRQGGTGADRMSPRELDGNHGGGSVVGRRYQVAFSFTGTEEDSSQLSLMTGDIVRVQCHDPSGWTYGRLELICMGCGSQRTSFVGDAGWFPEALMGCEEPEAVRMSPDLEEPSPATRKCGGQGNSSPVRSGSALIPGRSAEARRCSPAASRCSSQQNLDRCHSHRSFAEDNQFLPTSSRGSSKQRLSRGGRDREVLSKQASNISLEEETNRNGLEEGEAKLQECEQRLALCAQSRRRYARDCESAQRGASEAEVLAETTEKLLASLEEQERRCRAEASCAAGSNSNSLRERCEARLRMVLEKKEAALEELQVARDRVESERHNMMVAKRKLRIEQQAASNAVEAVSRQRGLVKAAQVQQLGSPAQAVAAADGVARTARQAAQPAIGPSLSSPALASPRPQSARPQSAARAGATGQPSSATSSRLRQRPAATSGSGSAVTASPSRPRSASPSKGLVGRGCIAPASPIVRGGSSPSSSTPSLAPGAAATGRGASTASRSTSRPTSPNQSRPRIGAQAAGRSTSSTGGQGTPLRRLGSAQQQTRPKVGGAGRPESPPRGQNAAGSSAPPPWTQVTAIDAPRPEAVWPLGATEDELTRAFDALQSAEALQAKLANMPEHLRASIFRQCPGLQGLVAGPRA